MKMRLILRMKEFFPMNRVNAFFFPKKEWNSFIYDKNLWKAINAYMKDIAIILYITWVLNNIDKI